MELCFQPMLASLFLILLSSHPELLLAQPKQHFLGQNNTTFLTGERPCNWFRGKWVYDSSYPLYSPFSCPFLDPEFNCQKAGRPDTYYQHFLWQPFSCSLPRYFAHVFTTRKHVCCKGNKHRNSVANRHLRDYCEETYSVANSSSQIKNACSILANLRENHFRRKFATEYFALQICEKLNTLAILQ